MARQVAIILTAAILAAVMSRPSYAQPSLAGVDRNDFEITAGGQTIVISILQDGRDRNQFYYVPDRPRLVTELVHGHDRPLLSLCRYQFKDVQDVSGKQEGGWLTFVVTLALPQGAIEQLKKEIAIWKGVAVEKVQLSALPIKNAQAYLFAKPKEDARLRDHLAQFIDSSAAGDEGMAPTFVTQDLGFSIFLTRNGADLISHAVKHDMLAVSLLLTYEGLTPRYGVKVTANWDRLYDHYSKNSEFAARASLFGLFGGGGGSSATEIYDNLTTSDCIKIESVTGAPLKQDQLDKILQPILKRINDEIIAAHTAPPKVNPAQAAKPSTGNGLLGIFTGWFSIGAGYSVAIKDVEDRRSGQSTFEYNTRQIVDMSTLASSLVGIASYPKPTQQSLITSVPAHIWEAAHVQLPNPSRRPEFAYHEVNVTTELRLPNQSRPLDSETASWTPDKGWTSHSGPLSTRRIFIPLMGHLARERVSLDDAILRIKTGVTRDSFPPDTITIEQDVKLSEQTSPIVSMSALDFVVVNGRALSFCDLQPDSRLVQVDVELTCGNRTLSTTIAPEEVNGRNRRPLPLVWPVPKGKTPVMCNIWFQLTDGSRHLWSRSGTDLRRSGGLTVNLNDAIWKGGNDEKGM